MNSLKLMNLSKVTSLESGKAVHSLVGKYSAVSKEHHPPKGKGVRKASQVM